MKKEQQTKYDQRDATSNRAKDAARDVQSILPWLKKEHSRVHMIGVGGVGMAGLAYLLYLAGHEVTGSDLCANRLTIWLQIAGLQVWKGHAADQVTDQVDWCIRSTAVREDHVEVQACRARDIPVFMRGAALAAYARQRETVAISGTHGKTTTTAMTAHILRTAGVDAGYFIGGLQPGLGVANGGSACFVAEADESDGTVALYQPNIALVTNIEYDHMEHFEEPAAMERCFTQFMDQTRKAICYCRDDAAATRLAKARKNAISYGFSEEADLRGIILSEQPMRTVFQITEKGRVRGEVTLPLHGRHNVSNALAAFAVARQYGITFREYRAALECYAPVARRFEYCGRINGAAVYSDYAHHPTEIRAALAMARQMNPEKTVVIFQPHRYTRTLALRQQFVEVLGEIDDVILCPVYAASEEKMAGGTSKDLFDALRAQGANQITLADSLDDAWQIALPRATSGCLLLLLGAGDIDTLARRTN